MKSARILYDAKRIREKRAREIEKDLRAQGERTRCAYRCRPPMAGVGMPGMMTTLFVDGRCEIHRDQTRLTSLPIDAPQTPALDALRNVKHGGPA